MRKRYIVAIILFLLPLIVIGALSVFDEDATVSERENRVLKPLPRFSLENLLFGDFTLEFEEYFTDHFPFRDDLLAANTELNRLYYFTPSTSKDEVSLLIPQDNDIAEGGEALPINTPGAPTGNTDEPNGGNVSPSPSTSPESASPSPAPDSSPTPSPTPEPTPEPEPELENPDHADFRSGSIIIVGDRAMEICYKNEGVMATYAETLNMYKEKMPDSRVINLVTPNGGEFYSPEEFHTGVHSQKDIIETTYNYMNDSVITVDAYGELRKHADEYLFFRTDHHWTQLGAYYAYVAFCETLGLEPYTLDQFETGTIENFVGSMYTFTSKYPQSSVLKENPDTLHYYRPIRNFTSRVYKDGAMDESTAYNGYVIASKVSQGNKYLAFIGGDTPLMHIKTDVGNGKKIIVIKESYGNAFVPFLVNHYEEIFVVDPRKFYGSDKPDFDLPSFVEDKAIDDVLVIDYPLVVSSKNYVAVLRNLID